MRNFFFKYNVCSRVENIFVHNSYTYLWNKENRLYNILHDILTVKVLYCRVSPGF